MNKAALQPLIVAVLATNLIASPGSDPRYQISNDGDLVEITILEQQPAPTRESKLKKFKEKINSSSLAQLLILYSESFRPNEQALILERVSKKRIRSFRDIHSLLSFFVREDLNARRAAERSLNRLSPDQDGAFSSVFVDLLDDEQPILRLFGLIGVERLRPQEALEILYEEAKKPFDIHTPSLAIAPTPAINFRIKFLTLEILADWEGKKVLKLINKRSKEAPSVAKLSATYFWKENLPTLMKWSRSRKREDLIRADFGWQASPLIEDLKATRETLWEVLNSQRYDQEIRHRAAIKLGLVASKDDVSNLLKLRQEEKKKKIRLLYETALFASQDPRIIPILRDHIMKNPNPDARAGALTQLSQFVEPDEYRKLLLEMVHNDPDKKNRDRASKTLQLSSE
ncbi:MAG: hypothetical protein COB53_07025 [Elusimicrobia bacterium]|nr:MAG: hypothetical protein COB53_07025 [Elusimicrobiota bacterium]